MMSWIVLIVVPMAMVRSKLDGAERTGAGELKG
jgi:hypothetical protein